MRDAAQLAFQPTRSTRSATVRAHSTASPEQVFHPRAHAERDGGLPGEVAGVVDVSTHALTRSATYTSAPACRHVPSFQPTRSRGARPSGLTAAMVLSAFNPRAHAERDKPGVSAVGEVTYVSTHALSRSATGPGDYSALTEEVSTHALTAERDLWVRRDPMTVECFNTRAHAERDPMQRGKEASEHVSTHALTRSATQCLDACGRGALVSTHALTRRATCTRGSA